MRIVPTVVAAALGASVGTFAGRPLEALAQGCAMCKTALDAPNDPLAQAFNVSTLFLMSMPYVVVGTFAAWIYLNWRKGGGS